MQFSAVSLDAVLDGEKMETLTHHIRKDRSILRLTLSRQRTLQYKTNNSSTNDHNFLQLNEKRGKAKHWSETQQESVRLGERAHTIGHVHLNKLEILKSDAFVFIKWLQHIHLFLVQKLLA